MKRTPKHQIEKYLLNPVEFGLITKNQLNKALDYVQKNPCPHHLVSKKLPLYMARAIDLAFGGGAEKYFNGVPVGAYFIEGYKELEFVARVVRPSAVNRGLWS